jgi:hypothetical protein
MKISYQIDPRPAELGGGWRLRLIEDGEEVGGGVFPLGEYDHAGTDEEAARYAYEDALAEAEAWVESHRDAKVTIYRIVCTRAYQMAEQGSGYSLRPWGENTPCYEGSDDGGREYLLPDGYTVAMSNGGTEEIYGPDGLHCAIVPHSSGLPQLVSASGPMPVLRPLNRTDAVEA